MKKFYALLIAVLVVLQVFFIPVLADGEEQTSVFVQKSLAETTLQEDLLGDPDASDQDVENFVFGRSIHLNVYLQFEIFAAAYECNDFTYSFYLYLKNEDIYNIGTPGSILYPLKDFELQLKRPDLPSGGSSTPPYLDPNLNDPFLTDIDSSTLPAYHFNTYSATVVDNTRHVAKIRLDLPSASPFILHPDSNTVAIDIDHIWYRIWGCDPVYQEFEGGNYTSSLRIDFSTATASAPVRSVSSRMLSHFATGFVASEPVLHLDVSLMSDRFSSSSLESWYQLNTAAFLIPNKYVDQYGKYLYVHYTYGVYNDVPMIVFPASYNYSDLIEYVDFCVSRQYPLSFFPYYDYQKLNYCPYFVFEVDSINHSSDGGYDVSTSTLLSAWNSLKSNESSSDYQSVLRCSSYESFDIWKGPKDSYQTVSFSDAHGWWSWAFAGVWPWDTVVDDSIDVPATELISRTSDLISLSAGSDSNLSDNLFVDESEAYMLRSLASSALSGDSSLAILRYSLTDYHIYSGEQPNSFYYDGHFHYEGQDGYLARNAIISQFQILEIGLSQEPYDTADIQSLILSGDIHLIDVESDPQDYIGGLESGDHLKEGIIIRYDPWKWLKRLIAILVVFFVLVVVFYVLKFIGVFRSAFVRRHGDPPEKRKRKRFFGRRKD